MVEVRTVVVVIPEVGSPSPEGEVEHAEYGGVPPVVHRCISDIFESNPLSFQDHPLWGLREV